MAHDVPLKKVRLELARTAGFPTGSSMHGYEFIAPVMADGRVDVDVWDRVKELCRVTRFWGDEPWEYGVFARTGHGWCFSYGHGNERTRENLFKLDRHHLTPGAFISVTEHDGVQRPFRVAAVTPLVMAD
jgi:hypothetical protein